jgi:hypothetical protein
MNSVVMVAFLFFGDAQIVVLVFLNGRKRKMFGGRDNPSGRHQVYAKILLIRKASK